MIDPIVSNLKKWKPGAGSGWKEGGTDARERFEIGPRSVSLLFYRIILISDRVPPLISRSVGSTDIALLRCSRKKGHLGKCCLALCLSRIEREIWSIDPPNLKWMRRQNVLFCTEVSFCLLEEQQQQMQWRTSHNIIRSYSCRGRCPSNRRCKAKPALKWNAQPIKVLL